MRLTVYNVSNHFYTFNLNRRGAKYRYYDNLTKSYKWGNTGEFDEIELKYCYGLHTHKDPNGSYAEGSDIEQTHTSVKGFNFTLASAIKADSFEQVLDVYWQNVVSTNFSFTWREGNERIEYNMNADEFNQFLYRFGRYDKSRKTIRGPQLSRKVKQEIESWCSRLVA